MYIHSPISVWLKSNTLTFKLSWGYRPVLSLKPVLYTWKAVNTDGFVSDLHGCKQEAGFFILPLKILTDCKYWPKRQHFWSTDWRAGSQLLKRALHYGLQRVILLWGWSDADLPEGLSRCWLVFSASYLSVLAGVMCCAKCVVWGECICAGPR